MPTRAYPGDMQCGWGVCKSTGGVLESLGPNPSDACRLPLRPGFSSLASSVFAPMHETLAAQAKLSLLSSWRINLPGFGSASQPPWGWAALCKGRGGCLEKRQLWPFKIMWGVGKSPKPACSFPFLLHLLQTPRKVVDPDILQVQEMLQPADFHLQHLNCLLGGQQSLISLSQVEAQGGIGWW